MTGAGGEGVLNLNSYYYSFDETGCRLVDELLAAVADAGHRSHHTEGWSECGSRGDGASPAEAIQHAAVRVAAALTAARAEVEAERDKALEKAEAIATRAGEEMTERGAWDEGMRDMAVRIVMRIRAARTAGASDGR